MPTTTPPQTLFDKLWQSHLVDQTEDGESLIYVDRHLVYEVTSPQAFEGLRLSGRKPWRPETTMAVADHNVPTTAAQRTSLEAIADPLSRAQVRQLGVNCQEFGITFHGLGQKTQGIIHVVGPEQGATLPGMTVVAGDSHTSTHGAFGALAFGVGTSDVEHVLATQCLAIRPMQRKGPATRARSITQTLTMFTQALHISGTERLRLPHTQARGRIDIAKFDMSRKGESFFHRIGNHHHMTEGALGGHAVDSGSDLVNIV